MDASSRTGQRAKQFALHCTLAALRFTAGPLAQLEPVATGWPCRGGRGARRGGAGAAAAGGCAGFRQAQPHVHWLAGLVLTQQVLRRTVPGLEQDRGPRKVDPCLCFLLHFYDASAQAVPALLCAVPLPCSYLLVALLLVLLFSCSMSAD